MLPKNKCGHPRGLFSIWTHVMLVMRLGVKFRKVLMTPLWLSEWCVTLRLLKPHYNQQHQSSQDPPPPICYIHKPTPRLAAAPHDRMAAEAELKWAVIQASLPHPLTLTSLFFLVYPHLSSVEHGHNRITWWYTLRDDADTCFPLSLLSFALSRPT